MKRTRNTPLIKRLSVFLSVGILLAALVLCALHIGLRRYAIPLNLADYTTLGLGAKGVPTAIIDVDAILTDLYLPNPRQSEINLADYPDVKALMQMQVALAYTDESGLMELNVLCDTRTLLRYGIEIETLSWTQEVKGVIALDSTQPEPLAAPTTEEEEEPPETPPLHNLSPGPLTSLLDQSGNGLNLRPVYERALSERDAQCRKLFGRNEWTVSKTQVIFVTDSRSGASNLFRAAYTAKQSGEGAENAPSYFFTVEIKNLVWTESGQVTFSSVETQAASDKKAAESLSAFSASRYTVTVLPGGGVSNPDRIAFDQNGFVRFAGLPTSYRLASGLYWSPTYDWLTEDHIWQLTGITGHSLSNLLRYARKEISARYGCPFDPERESEFFRHYGAQRWYSADADYTDERMTETEARNIRLLREIQSLIDN
ncbi:MAG: YARHG domain-containing protein [Clostridiales bacterium]|nr:YARHG domain-containing protein [Clostridiales bacterium]